MTPESRSVRPATATGTTASRTVATEIAAEVDSAVVVEVAGDEAAEGAGVASVVVEATTITGTITTAMEVETVTVPEMDTATMMGMKRMDTRTEIAEASEDVAAVVEEDVVDVEVAADAISEVVTTARMADLAVEEVVADSGLAATTITMKTLSRTTSLGSCTSLLHRPKMKTKSSEPASAPESISTNSTTSR